MAELVVTRKVVLETSVESAWELLTQSKHVKEWYAFGGAKIDARVGAPLTYRWDEHGSYHGIITECDAPTRYAYRWSQLADAHPAPGNETAVTFDLEAVEDGTLVVVRERGFETLDVEGIEPKEIAAACADAWAAGFAELQRIAAG